MRGGRAVVARVSISSAERFRSLLPRGFLRRCVAISRREVSAKLARVSMSYSARVWTPPRTTLDRTVQLGWLTYRVFWHGGRPCSRQPQYQMWAHVSLSISMKWVLSPRSNSRGSILRSRCSSRGSESRCIWRSPPSDECSANCPPCHPDRVSSSIIFSRRVAATQPRG